MTHGLFITGTNTEVGKTVVASMIVRSLVRQGHRVGVYKPAASGCRLVDGEMVADDAVALWEAAGKPATLEQVCPQRFLAPLAPHVAARKEERRVDEAMLREGLKPWVEAYEVVVVEGVGGLMSPLSEEDYVADLALEFGFPLVVVAPNTLGVINQTLQTLITASTFREGIDIAGIVLNDVVLMSDESATTNRAELEKRCVPPLLAHVKHEQTELPDEIHWI